MKAWLQKALVVLFVFPLGLFVGSKITMCYEANTFKPWGWNDPPIIANCYGPELNILYIQSAVDFWKPYGEEVAFIVDEPMDEICKHKHLDGFILLKKAPHNYHGDDSTLASTTRRVVLFEMRSSVIRFNPGSYRLDNVFEHELGHAFGYGHIDHEGHIMHPHFEKMGPRFWIP